MSNISAVLNEVQQNLHDSAPLRIIKKEKLLYSTFILSAVKTQHDLVHFRLFGHINVLKQRKMSTTILVSFIVMVMQDTTRCNNLQRPHAQSALSKPAQSISDNYFDKINLKDIKYIDIDMSVTVKVDVITVPNCHHQI